MSTKPAGDRAFGLTKNQIEVMIALRRGRLLKKPHGVFRSLVIKGLIEHTRPCLTPKGEAVIRAIVDD